MIEMEEERLRMREHVMNEVCSRSHSASSMLACDVTASVPFPGGHQQRQTRLFRGVPGRYSEKGILGARQLGGDVTPERWSRWGKREFFCRNRSPHLLCFFRRWSTIRFTQTRRWESSRSTSLSRSRTWTWGLSTSRNRETIWSDNRSSSTPRRLSYNRWDWEQTSVRKIT